MESIISSLPVLFRMGKMKKAPLDFPRIVGAMQNNSTLSNVRLKLRGSSPASSFPLINFWE
jgi:hypothetical protein